MNKQKINTNYYYAVKQKQKEIDYRKFTFSHELEAC